MKIRPYAPGDEKAILVLDARVLPSLWNPRTLDNWHWKFTEKNPAGRSFIWLAEHEGQIIAHFAAVPFRLKMFDKETTASHTIGALVEEKYQNRGLLKLLGEKIWEELAQKNIHITWGFPNQRAYRFHKVALGFEDLINFDVWKITKTDILKSGADPSCRAIEEFDADFDRLWEECSSQHDIAVVRNKTYLNWRYLMRPDWLYYPFGYYEDSQLKGYVVLKIFREDRVKRGHIVDIFSNSQDRHTLDCLISESLAFFSQQKVDEATVWIWGNPLIEHLLEDKGFLKKPADIPLLLRIHKNHPLPDRMKDNSHWYFAMGDSTEIF
jgi:GNAT superfamily N-acetyltransferase